MATPKTTTEALALVEESLTRLREVHVALLQERIPNVASVRADVTEAVYAAQTVADKLAIYIKRHEKK